MAISDRVYSSQEQWKEPKRETHMEESSAGMILPGTEAKSRKLDDSRTERLDHTT